MAVAPNNMQMNSAPAAQSAPASTSQAELDKQRVSLILDINSHLLASIESLQASGKGGDVQSPTNPADPSASNKPPREYVEPLRRMQANLAYLANLAERNTKPTQTQQPWPQIMTAPAGDETLGPMYHRLQSLFPKWVQAQRAQAAMQAQQAAQAQVAGMQNNAGAMMGGQAQGQMMGQAGGMGMGQAQQQQQQELEIPKDPTLRNFLIGQLKSRHKYMKQWWSESLCKDTAGSSAGVDQACTNVDTDTTRRPPDSHEKVLLLVPEGDLMSRQDLLSRSSKWRWKIAGLDRGRTGMRTFHGRKLDIGAWTMGGRQFMITGEAAIDSDPMKLSQTLTDSYHVLHHHEKPTTENEVDAVLADVLEGELQENPSTFDNIREAAEEGRLSAILRKGTAQIASRKSH